MSTKRQQNARLSLEKKAWFLCKFLSSSLDEDNFEKLRYHVSICKGVKTKVKLSEKGWATGYKSSSIRHFSHKLPYQYFPLEFIENIHQDVMFVNVLLCVFRMQNLPGIQYEIVAYKFADNTTVKKYQDIFQILTGGTQSQTLRAPGSSLTLVPGRQYHMGTLSPDRWGSRDRLADDSIAPSETQVKVQDTGRGRMTNGTRMVLDSEGSWSGGSSLLEDAPMTLRANDGTVVAQVGGGGGGGSTYGGGRPRGITLTSMDSIDGPVSRRGGGPVTGDQTSLRKVYQPPPSERGRTPDPSVMMTSRNRYQSTDSASQYGRSRSVEPFGRGGGGYMPSNQSDIYRPSDAMSVKSQSSYLLSPNFKKVYAKRSGMPPPQQQMGYAASQGSYLNIPRAYEGSQARRNNGW